MPPKHNVADNVSECAPRLSFEVRLARKCFIAVAAAATIAVGLVDRALGADQYAAALGSFNVGVPDRSTLIICVEGQMRFLNIEAGQAVTFFDCDGVRHDVTFFDGVVQDRRRPTPPKDLPPAPSRPNWPGPSDRREAK